MPEAYLDELDATTGPPTGAPGAGVAAGQRLKVIVDDGLVVGFAAAGPENDGRDEGIGELYAINVDPKV